jgi:sarcosine oxidase/L-pipecolate oxidase
MLRWRPEIAVGRDWRDTQDRFGADGKVMDFQSVREWTQIGEGNDAI